MMTQAGREWLDRERVADPDPAQIELPWGGRSPRVLTKAYQRFTLTARGDAADLDLDDLIEEQYRRFLQDGTRDGTEEGR